MSAWASHYNRLGTPSSHFKVSAGWRLFSLSPFSRGFSCDSRGAADQDRYTYQSVAQNKSYEENKQTASRLSVDRETNGHFVCPFRLRFSSPPLLRCSVSWSSARLYTHARRRRAYKTRVLFLSGRIVCLFTLAFCRGVSCRLLLLYVCLLRRCLCRLLLYFCLLLRCFCRLLRVLLPVWPKRPRLPSPEALAVGRVARLRAHHIAISVRREAAHLCSQMALVCGRKWRR